MREPFQVEVPDMSHMIPMQISVAKLKAMSDAELLAALNGEDGRKGMMTLQFATLITSELQARSIERAGKPHWSAVPSFWLLVTSVVLSLVAIVVAVFTLPQVQQRFFQNPSQLRMLGTSEGTTEGSLPASKSSEPTQAVPHVR